MSVRFKLKGEMPSKKNRWKVGKGGQVFIPKDVKSELDDMLWQLKSVRSKNVSEPIAEPIKVEVIFYGQYRKDLDNMTTTLLDLLQKSEIIKNDKEVLHIDAKKRNDSPKTAPWCEVTITIL